MAMCIFVNCNNLQKPFSSLTFFRLPNDSRRPFWIAASGNPELGLLSVPKQEKVKRVVCERHFAESLLRKQFNRTILYQHAIPRPWHYDGNPLPANDEGKENRILYYLCIRNAFCTTADAQIALIQTKSMNSSAPKLQEDDICLETRASSTSADVRSFNIPADTNNVLVECVPFTESLPNIEPPNISVDSDYCDNIEYSYESDGMCEEGNDFDAHRFDFAQCSNEITNEILERANDTANEVYNTPVFHQDDVIERVENIESVPDESNENISLPSKCSLPSNNDPAKLVNRPTAQPKNRVRNQRGRIRLIKKASWQPTQKLLRRKTVRKQKKETDQPDILTMNAASTEDTYFALSLVGCLQRLNPMQRAMAKVNVLRYLTELEFADKAEL